MTTTSPKPKTRNPITYEGSGSAIDNYNFAKTAPVAPVAKKENWGFFTKTAPNPSKRKVLFSRMYTAQWTTTVQGKEMPDLARLSDFLQSEKSPVKKPLRKLDDLEIEKIITAFDGIVKAKYK